MFPLFVNLKKVYDRNVLNKYRLYLLLGVIMFNLIEYIYIKYIYLFVDSSLSMDVHSLFYLISIVFLDISMPLLESMLLSLLLTPVERIKIQVLPMAPVA